MSSMPDGETRIRRACASCVPSAAVGILKIVVGNIAESPEEKKFRSLNPKREKIGLVWTSPECRAVLEACGFRISSAEDGGRLTLAMGKAETRAAKIASEALSTAAVHVPAPVASVQGGAGGVAGKQPVLHLLEDVQKASGTLEGHCIGNLWLITSGKFFEHWAAADKNKAKKTFLQRAGVIDDDGSESDASDDDEKVCPARVSSHSSSLTHSLTARRKFHGSNFASHGNTWVSPAQKIRCVCVTRSWHSFRPHVTDPRLL